jgi:hypothetical protein
VVRRRRPPQTRAEQAEKALLAELQALYRETDELYAGYGCAESTECCRFAITGREPYVTSIELYALERAVAARGGPLKPVKRALPLAPQKGALRDDERTCPLLNADARCAVYQARPFGCRTFWCDRADTDAPVSHKQMSALVTKLRALASQHQTGGEQGRPITRALTPVPRPPRRRSS